MLSTLFAGVVFLIFYFACCATVELRYAILAGMLTRTLGNLFSLLLISGKVNPSNTLLYLCFTDQAFNAIQTVLQLIPTQVAIGKLIPNNIEATMFAALTGIIQLTAIYWPKVLGGIWNLAFDVTKEDLSNLWKLYTIATVFAALPVLFIWVAPSNAQIKQTQKCIKFMDEYDEAEHVKDKIGLDQTELFISLKQNQKKSKAADQKKNNKSKDGDNSEEEEYVFHKEIRNLEPSLCRQFGLYERVKSDYGLDFDPQVKSQVEMQDQNNKPNILKQ